MNDIHETLRAAESGDTGAMLELSEQDVYKRQVFLTLEGVEDRDAAEKLRGELLYIDRAHAVELDEDTNCLLYTSASSLRTRTSPTCRPTAAA